MRNNTYRVFIIVAAVVTILLLLHLAPTVSIGGVNLRSVDLLSQLTDTTWQQSEEVPIEKDTTRTFPHLDDFSADSSMSLFFAKLDSLKNKKTLGRPIRIAVFGDSFIEGDIIIGELREQLQTRYGGNGVGWIDAGNALASERTTFSAHSKGLTEHLTIKSDTYNAQDAGPAQRYYTMDGNEATFSGYGVAAYPHAMVWQKATLFLKTKTGLRVSSTDGGTPFVHSVSPSDHVQAVSLPVRKGSVDTPSSISFSVQGSGILYGVSMESAEGIMIDNYSMRGDSGIRLHLLSASVLKDFQTLRPYDLIVMQYGANVINQKTREGDLRWYRLGTEKAIELFKQCFPDVPIMLVSTPDRGARIQGSFATMESVPMLIGVQRQLAQDHGVAFYNLYEAMGGHNSMARLLNSDLCNKDMIHLKIKGGQVVAHRILGQND